MLLELTLTNFKRHEHLHVTFTEGLNVITGPNFSGKSTILHGILYALGGPSLVPGGAAIVTRKGHTGISVELSFVAGKTYRILRKAKSAVLFEDDVEIARTASAVTDHLEQVLGMSMRRFSQLKYGEQKHTESLLTMGATELNTIIQELCQAEVINQVIDRCREEVTKAEGALEQIPDVDLSGLQEEYTSLQKQMVPAHAELTRRHAELIQLTANIKDLSKEYEQIQAVETARQALRLEVQSLSATLQRSKTSWALAEKDISELGNADSEYQRLFEEISSAEKTLAVIGQKSKQYVQCAAAVDSLSQRISTNSQLIQAKHVDIAKVGEIPSVVDLTSAHQLVYNEWANVRQELRSVAAALETGVCGECKRPYSTDPGWEDSMREKVLALKSKEIPLRTETEAQKRTLDRAIADETLVVLLTSERNTLTEVTAILQGELDEKVKEMELLAPYSAEVSCTELEENLALARKDLEITQHQVIQLSAARKQYAEAEQGIADSFQRLQKIGEVPDAISLQELYTPIQASSDKLASLNSEYSVKHAAYSTQTGQLAILEDHVSRAKRNEEARHSLTARVSTCKALAKFLRKNRDGYLGGVWQGITDYAGEFVSRCTGGAVSAVTRTDKGDFTYVEYDQTMPVAAASGAQRSLMGLGVQLAMAEMLPSALGTLMLDEPSDAADEERSLALASLLSATHDQILLVSHRQLDGAVATNTINLEDVA